MALNLNQLCFVTSINHGACRSCLASSLPCSQRWLWTSHPLTSTSPVYVVLGIENRTLCMLGKHFTYQATVPGTSHYQSPYRTHSCQALNVPLFVLKANSLCLSVLFYGDGKAMPSHHWSNRFVQALRRAMHPSIYFCTGLWISYHNTAIIRTRYTRLPLSDGGHQSDSSAKSVPSVNSFASSEFGHYQYSIYLQSLQLSYFRCVSLYIEFVLFRILLSSMSGERESKEGDHQGTGLSDPRKPSCFRDAERTENPDMAKGMISPHFIPVYKHPWYLRLRNLLVLALPCFALFSCRGKQLKGKMISFLGCSLTLKH